MKNISEFIGLYPLSKTLRFELIPQGKTLDHIEKNGLLEQDNQRADSYKLVKKIIDEYHKFFIENSLIGLELNFLEDYYTYYQIQKRDEVQKKSFEEIQSKMRKQIADRFAKNEKYKNLFGKELIKEDLKNFVANEEDKELVKEFENFTTYFTGFHENRKNMYSNEDKSTAIAYRLIHQNLPKFIDNMRIFVDKVLETNLKEKFSEILSDSQLGPVIQVVKVDDVFKLEYFNDTLTQTGIDKYNHLIGGYTSEDGKTKIQGLNEYINLYNQNVKDKKLRIPKLKPLFKQILSDRSTASFIPEQFESDNEVLESIEKLYQELKEHVFDKNIEGEHSLKELLQNLSEFDLCKIYLRNDTSITDISQKLYGDWGMIQKALNVSFEKNYKGKAKPDTEKFEEERKKYFNQFDSYSIAYINECVSLLPSDVELKTIEYYFTTLGKSELEKDLFEVMVNNYDVVKELLNTPYPKEKDLSQQQADVDKIKLFLDSIKKIQWFIKPLLGKGSEAEKDERFYGEFALLWETLDQITLVYNKVRNYMTRKPYSTEKIKLNFENSTLLDGWDVNKESDNTSIIFRKNGLFYLGIMNKKHNKIFKSKIEVKDEAFFEKMEYKLLPGANKMLPKVFFSNSRIEEFAPSNDLLTNYKNETHKKGEKFNINHCHELIDFFKTSINKHEDWKNFDFQFSNTQKYEDLSGFYREVEQQGYKITWRNIPEKFIHNMVEEGKLYLFQIYNKDFSPFSKGTPNIHTLYWKMLFDVNNLKNVVYKLNGQAEVFFRKASINEENIIIHKAHEKINNKNDNNEKKQSVFEYDLIKDRRYTVDKFQFHVPITLNFKGKGLNNINTLVNEFIQKNENLHVIGIDRGERHLLYLTMIDNHGKIVVQYTLNEIINEYNGNKYLTNYHDLLNSKEGNRDEERRNWKTIENIKELKQGYLSQVIHKICELMVKYNAIVVLEDLNMGFMRGRQKVEKSVYQQFEKMLIDKLNYLVDKKKSPLDIGGTLKAYQLTNKFESFQKLGKQSGFLYYVPAWNTSKMDPVTGFVNLFQLKYENIDKSQKFFEKFDVIRFNKEKNWFEFGFDYMKFTNKAEGTKTQWTACTNQERIESFRNPDRNSEWDSREILLTPEFEKLFQSKNIEYIGVENIVNDIVLQNDKTFFEKLFYLLRLTLQMRNSKTGTDIDYLISPVANDKGEFYDSRKANKTLPENADANGAFNIARKGQWVIEQIKKADNVKNVKLAISNKEWLQFVQK